MSSDPHPVETRRRKGLGTGRRICLLVLVGFPPPDYSLNVLAIC